MDPDANVEERIQLLIEGKNNGWNAAQAIRYADLSQTYSEWKANGGFPADAALLAKLDQLRQAQFQNT